jgi:hypothetical protein
MSIENIRRIKENAGKPRDKKIYRIPKKSAKKLKQEAEEKELLKAAKEMGKGTGISDQEQWFEDRMKESLPVCMNCGMEANWLLQPEYKKIWRACQAHILPKRKAGFPSVATHPMNHLVLFPVWGGHLCGCHNEYDSSWYNATTMKVWGIAKHRFNEFENSISKNERGRIPEQFLKTINEQ